VAKVKKMLSLWCNKWLSRWGRCVLAKFVLEAIYVHRISLDFILKGILERIRRITFRFLWA
jgi:hypothetical protein